MKIVGLTIIEISEIVLFMVLAVSLIRNTVTKKQVEKKLTKHRDDIDKELEKGSNEFKEIRTEFKEIRSVQTIHGEQLAGIGSTVNSMATSVEKLVDHHIGEK